MKIFLKLKRGTIEVDIHDDPYETPCKQCGKKIIWGKTVNDKDIPVSKFADGKWYAHFFDCNRKPKPKKNDGQQRLGIN